jgi:hypothetical protein
MQSLGLDFVLSRRRFQGFIQTGLGVPGIYGDSDMPSSPILGTCDNVSTDGADADGMSLAC